jgi:hypothetical protein
MPRLDRSLLDRARERLPDVPDAHRYMPRPPRDLAELGRWAERSYGFCFDPHSIWLELAERAKEGIANGHIK